MAGAVRVAAFALSLVLLVPAVWPGRILAMSEAKYEQPMLASLGEISVYDGKEVILSHWRHFKITKDTIVCINGRKVSDPALVDIQLKHLIKTDVVVLEMLKSSPDYAAYKGVALRIDPGFISLVDGKPQMPACEPEESTSPAP